MDKTEIRRIIRDVMENRRHKYRFSLTDDHINEVVAGVAEQQNDDQFLAAMGGAIMAFERKYAEFIPCEPFAADGRIYSEIYV